MGSITITVVGDASVGTKTKAFTISNAHVNRLVAWAKIAYATPALPSPTTAEALLAWVTDLIERTKGQITSLEYDEARKALTPPPPIDTT